MRALLSLISLLLTMASAHAQEFETRIFQLYHRPAEATVEMVRPLLSSQGTVLPEPRLQKLFVRDTSERLKAVERLLVEIDQPAAHVQIAVTMHGHSRGANGTVAVGPSGATATAHQGSGQADSQQTLLVMSGEHGMIMMARDIVTVEPYLNFCRQHKLVPPGLIVSSVSTGFAVQPIVQGDMVRLTITPWLSFLGGSGRVEVLADGASTTLALRSGQEATIADAESGRGLRRQAFGLIFESQRHTIDRSSSITVRPEIVDL